MKYFTNLLLVIFLLGIFNLGINISQVSATTVTNSQMTISQFVELMITIGAVPANRAATVRAMVASLNKTDVASTTATSSLPYIQVLAPNGGESWEVNLGVPYTISWGSSSQIPVNISLVPSKGAECKLTPAPVISKDTTNNYSILLKKAMCYNQVAGTSTPVTDGTYKVRVSYVNESGAVVKDESNSTFIIKPIPVPGLKVTYPNGTENLIRNKSYDVKYILKDVTPVSDDLIYFYLLDSNGSIAYNGYRAVSKGLLSVDLPLSLTPGAYKIKLKFTTHDRIVIEDVSDNFFWISSANKI